MGIAGYIENIEVRQRVLRKKIQQKHDVISTAEAEIRILQIKLAEAQRDLEDAHNNRRKAGRQ